MFKLLALTLLLLQTPSLFASEFSWTVTVTDLSSRKQSVYRPMDQKMRIPAVGAKAVCHLSESDLTTTSENVSDARWVECTIGATIVRTMAACYRNRSNGYVTSYPSSIQIYGEGNDRNYALGAECK